MVSNHLLSCPPTHATLPSPLVTTLTLTYSSFFPHPQHYPSLLTRILSSHVHPSLSSSHLPHTHIGSRPRSIFSEGVTKCFRFITPSWAWPSAHTPSPAQGETHPPLSLRVVKYIPLPEQTLQHVLLSFVYYRRCVVWRTLWGPGGKACMGEGSNILSW